MAKLREGAESEKAALDSVILTIEKASGENDKLFGSVTAMEIEAILHEQGHRVDRRRIQLGENIKSLGEYDIPVKLHRDVTATIKVLVVARPESD